MAIQVTFQLDSPRERADVGKCINALEDNKYPFGNRQIGKQVDTHEESRIKELEEKNKELVKENDAYRKNTAKEAERIEKLVQELKEKKEEADLSAQLAKEAEEKAAKMKEEHEKTIEKIESEHKKEIEKLSKEWGIKESELKGRIEDMRKRLEIYEPSINMSANSETTYYNVDDDLLVQTNSLDAPYFAKNRGDGKFNYQFNYEKGPVREACSKKDSMLLPFCDIEEEAENPSNIRPGEWGIAIMQGGDLKVEKKAKIKLYRD